MSTTLDAVFSSWPAQPWLAAMLLVTAAVYWRGWRVLRDRDRQRWRGWRLAAFISGLATIYIALASPIEAFAALVASAHVAALAVDDGGAAADLVGRTFLPLLRRMPREIRRYWIGPVLRWRPLRRLGEFVTHPAAAFLIFVLVTWIWHLPGPYQTALTNDGWHKLQHAFFLTAGLIFWYPVVRPFPARPAWSNWWLVPYLLLGDVQNTLLSAWLTFSDSVLYPYYLAMPRLGGVSALDDQSAAGVLMWVPGSILFLVPLGWIGVRLMQGRSEGNRRRVDVSPTVKPRSRSTPPIVDALRWPVIGQVLRSRWTRRCVQFAVLLVVIAVIVDGLFGTQVGAMNLAGVAPWIHWRGLIILGMLVAGNVFCYGCPFVLPRTVARRLFGNRAGWQWPRALRSKWPAIVLLAIFLLGV